MRISKDDLKQSVLDLREASELGLHHAATMEVIL